MAGLLNSKQRTLAPAQEDESNVTPELQAEYNRFVTNGMRMLYNQKAMPQILESIRGDGNPVEGLANALVMLVMRLEDSAAQQGQQIDGDIMEQGGAELLEQMVDLAEKAGVHKFKEKEMESALYLAMDLYRTTRQQQGRLPEEQLAADMQELMRADQAGELEQMIPGITEYAKKAPKPEQIPRGR